MAFCAQKTEKAGVIYMTNPDFKIASINVALQQSTLNPRYSQLMTTVLRVMIVTKDVAVKLRKIIGSEKTITDYGEWKSGMKMPKTAFPLSKHSGFKIAKAFNWRIVRFECLGAKFRLLICYRIDLHRFITYLAKDVNDDMMILARYEYHAGEPGWHVHAICDDEKHDAGRTGGDDKRMPPYGMFHKNMVFDVFSDEAAFNKVVKAFRLEKREPFKLVAQ